MCGQKVNISMRECMFNLTMIKKTKFKAIHNYVKFSLTETKSRICFVTRNSKYFVEDL